MDKLFRKGLLATFITLVLIPAEYMILEDIKRLSFLPIGKQTAKNPELVIEGALKAKSKNNFLTQRLDIKEETK